MVLNVDVGQIIAGKYELVRLLGKGAMGEVWRATHNTLGGEVAIKLVEPTDDIEAETAAGRFQLEAQIAAKLSRKTRHIVSVSDHGEENGLAYLVMELLEGESLEQRVARYGTLGLADVAALVSQVARALVLAHEEGIFHRDIKPANILLGRDEDGRLLVKLLDFGIARSKKPFRTRSPFATSKDMVLGTPSYMSPEQARGLDTLDHRCDVWALAVVAYEALAGKLPFDGQTIEDIFLSICTFRVIPIRVRRPDLPSAVEEVFARAFTSNIEQRFRTAAEFSAAFEELVSPDQLAVALGIPASSSGRLVARRPSDPSLEVTAPESDRRLRAAQAPGVWPMNRQPTVPLGSLGEPEHRPARSPSSPHFGPAPNGPGPLPHHQTTPALHPNHPDVVTVSPVGLGQAPLNRGRGSYPDVVVGHTHTTNVTPGPNPVAERSNAPLVLLALIALMMLGTGAFFIARSLASGMHSAERETTAAPPLASASPSVVVTPDSTPAPTLPTAPTGSPPKSTALPPKTSPPRPPASAPPATAPATAVVAPLTSSVPPSPPAPAVSAKAIDKGNVF